MNPNNLILKTLRFYLGSPMGLSIGVLFLASGCRPPYALVNIEDSFGVGAAVVEIRIGTGPDRTQAIERPENLSFPMDITLTGEDGVRREVYAEGVNAQGEVLAYGTVEVVFDRTSERVFRLILQTDCTEDSECIDDLWCNGVEACVAGRCQVGEPECPSSRFACVVNNICDEVNQKCIAELNHDICLPELIGTVSVSQYCDASRGCTEGTSCSVDSECDDGVVCNGVELCVNSHCINGVGKPVDDDNPCTVDTCVGDGEEVHFNEPEGNGCDTFEKGICIEGVCTPSVCGDGFLDLILRGEEQVADEECDDGDANEDAPNACRTDCTLPAFGDGIIDTDLAEECDDSNRIDNDACTNLGKINECGDGVVDEVSLNIDGSRKEECDDGPDDSDFDYCKSDCTLNYCGDGKINAEVEACDDGNRNSNDGCDACLKTNWVSEVVFGFGEGGAQPEALNLGSPGPMAIDRAGNIFWSEVSTSIVRRWDAREKKVSLFAGDGSPTFKGDNGPATRAGVGGIYGMAVDGQNNVYISDFDDHRVRKIDGQTGIITTIAGVGTAGFSGDNGPAILAEMNHPTGIAIDGLGDLFVIESGNNIVRKINTRTGIITTVSGIAGEGCESPRTIYDNVDANLAKYCNPEDIKIDRAGNLYVLDKRNYMIRRVNKSDNKVVFVAGNGVNIGSGALNVSPLPAKSVPLGAPLQMALDDAGENIYYTTSLSNVIRHVDLVRGTSRNIACAGRNKREYSGDGGLALDAGCDSPFGVVVNSQGEVFFGDQDNSRIRKLTPDGEGNYRISLFSGVEKISGADINNAAVLLPILFRLLPGSVGLQYTIPNNIYNLSAGVHLNSDIGDTPSVIAEESSNRIFMRLYDANIIVIAGNNERNYYGDGLKGTLAAFNRPTSVTFSVERMPVRISTNPIIIDGSRRSGLQPRYLYVADTGNNVIRRIELEGENYANGVFIKPVGDHIVTTIVGTGEAGFSGHMGAAEDFQLDHPTGVSVLSNGNILIADTGNHRIVEYDPATDAVTTVLGITNSGPPAPGFTENGLASAARVDSPHSLVALPISAVEGLTNAVGDIVFFADRNNHRIRALIYAEIDGVEVKFVINLAGSGVRGYAGDGGSALEASLEYPSAVMPFMSDECINNSGGSLSCKPSLLIADGFDRVRSLELGLIEISQGQITVNGIITTLEGEKEPQYDGSYATAIMRSPVGFTSVNAETGAWLFTDASVGTVRTWSFQDQTLETVAGFPRGFDYVDAAQENRAQYARKLEDLGKIVFNRAKNEAYVAEAGRHVIRKIKVFGNNVDFRSSGTEMLLLAGGVDLPGVENGNFANARFVEPYGLALDEENQILYVSEVGSHTIRALKLDEPNSENAVVTVAGQAGVRGNFGDGGGAHDALLNEPKGIFISDNGLYISDTANHRVRWIAEPLSAEPIIEAVLGDSVASSSGEGLGAKGFPVDTPVGLLVDSKGNLFVTSRTSVRVVAAGDDGVATGEDAVHTIYGKAPRAQFPEPVTQCIESIQLSQNTESEVYIIDACQGYLIKLSRQRVSYP